MRVVLDTNVLVSAALKERSLPGTVVGVAATNHRLLKSKTTEQELFVTLARPRLAALVPLNFREWLHHVMSSADLVIITEHIAACRDRKDDKFLELAVNGDADVIITGDNDLLTLHPFRSIPILTPAEFLQVY